MPMVNQAQQQNDQKRMLAWHRAKTREGRKKGRSGSSSSLVLRTAKNSPSRCPLPACSQTTLALLKPPKRPLDPFTKTNKYHPFVNDIFSWPLKSQKLQMKIKSTPFLLRPQK